MIVSRMFTKDQAKRMYPQYESKIKNATSDRSSDRPNTGREHDGKAIFPEDIETMTDSALGQSDEYVRGYERYYKEMVSRYRVHETFTGVEHVFDDDEYEEYVNKQAYIIEGRPIVREDVARMTMERLQQSYQEMLQQAEMQGVDPEQLPEPPSLEVTVMGQFIEEGLIKVVEIQTCRVCQVVIMGDQLLYKKSSSYG